MRITRSYLLYILLSLAFISCDDDDEDEFSLVGTNFSIAAITGTWNATQAIYGNFSGPAVSVDVVAEGGTVVLQIFNNGSFQVTVTQLGSTPETSSGQMGFDEDLLVISFDDDPEDFEFFGTTFNDPILTINGGNGLVEFDLDNDGVDDPAIIDFILERQ